MRIVVAQSCGLGNQLFQYAAGLYLANKYSARLRIAAAPSLSQMSEGHARPLLLSKFKINAQLNKWNYVDRFLISKRREIESLKLRARLRIQLLEEKPESEYVFCDFEILPSTRIAYIVGYWQSNSIVRAVEQDLRKQLVLRDAPTGRNLEMIQRIQASGTPVSLHIRRGDYGKVFGEKSLLTHQYYEMAIREIRSRVGRATFFVFSDDKEFSRKWIGGQKDFVHVDHNDESSAHEDLRLMSLCSHHIVANSTFSWWGAWLNSTESKNVILPAKWIGRDTAETDLRPPGWILLPA